MYFFIYVKLGLIGNKVEERIRKEWKTKHAKFSEKRTFLTPLCNSYVII